MPPAKYRVRAVEASVVMPNNTHKMIGTHEGEGEIAVLPTRTTPPGGTQAADYSRVDLFGFGVSFGGGHMADYGIAGFIFRKVNTSTYVLAGRTPVYSFSPGADGHVLIG